MRCCCQHEHILCTALYKQSSDNKCYWSKGRHHTFWKLRTEHLQYFVHTGAKTENHPLLSWVTNRLQIGNCCSSMWSWVIQILLENWPHQINAFFPESAHTAVYMWHYLTTPENTNTNNLGAWHSNLWVRWLLHYCSSSWDPELCFSCTIPAAFILTSSCSGGRRNTRTTVMLSVEPDALAWHTKCWATSDP